MESIFETKEQYLKMRSNFKKWYNIEGNKEKLFAGDFALYAAIRGKDWRKCFAENTSESKIDVITMYLTKTRIEYLNLKPYGEEITAEMIETLRSRGIAGWGE